MSTCRHPKHDTPCPLPCEACASECLGRAPRYTVAVFMIDRAWGGPEEGGWWFDYGAPADDEYRSYTRRFTSNEAAVQYCVALQHTVIEEANKGRHPISSMISDGEYRAFVCEGDPTPFPEHRPHYE